MGMFTDTSTNPSICTVPRPLPEKQVPGVGKPFYVGPSPSYPTSSGIWRREKSAQPGAEECHKRLENIADNPAGEDPAELGHISLPDRTPAKTHLFTNSCAEPIFLTRLFSKLRLKRRSNS
jgi:hypothetical protein